MSFEFLGEFFVPVIAGICLCLGYAVKTATAIDNKYIPSINAAVGLLLALWLHWGAVTPDVLLSGMFSGLAATGLYEAFAQIINGSKQ